jgi:hypothetical protein
MSLQKRLLVTLMLSASLVACGGGGGSNDNLFNPAESDSGTTEDDTDTSTEEEVEEDTSNVGTSESGITSLEPGDTTYITNSFVGLFIERINEESEDYKLGTALMKTYANPNSTSMSEGAPFEAMLSYKFNECQPKNAFLLQGFQLDDGSLENAYQDTQYIDSQSTGTVLKEFDVTWNGDGMAYYGLQQLAAAEWVDASDTCTAEQYRLALQSEVAFFPVNAQFYSDSAADVNVELNESNQRVISWNYEYFTSSGDSNKHFTLALYDATAFNSTSFFSEYAALPSDASEEDVAEAAGDFLANPQMTEDFLLWQQVIPGSTTSFSIPNSVNLIDGNDYILVVAAWESGDNAGNATNQIYYFTSLTFKYKD